jgi:hypothetical protein
VALGHIQADVQAFGMGRSHAVGKNDGGAEEPVGIVNVAEVAPPVSQIQAQGLRQLLRDADFVSRGRFRGDVGTAATGAIRERERRRAWGELASSRFSTCGGM